MRAATLSHFGRRKARRNFAKTWATPAQPDRRQHARKNLHAERLEKSYTLKTGNTPKGSKRLYKAFTARQRARDTLTRQKARKKLYKAFTARQRARDTLTRRKASGKLAKGIRSGTESLHKAERFRTNQQSRQTPANTGKGKFDKIRQNSTKFDKSIKKQGTKRRRTASGKQHASGAAAKAGTNAASAKPERRAQPVGNHSAITLQSLHDLKDQNAQAGR